MGGVNIIMMENLKELRNWVAGNENINDQVDSIDDLIEQFEKYLEENPEGPNTPYHFRKWFLNSFREPSLVYSIEWALNKYDEWLIYVRI